MRTNQNQTRSQLVDGNKLLSLKIAISTVFTFTAITSHAVMRPGDAEKYGLPGRAPLSGPHAAADRVACAAIAGASASTQLTNPVKNFATQQLTTAEIDLISYKKATLLTIPSDDNTNMTAAFVNHTTGQVKVITQRNRRLQVNVYDNLVPVANLSVRRNESLQLVRVGDLYMLQTSRAPNSRFPQRVVGLTILRADDERGNLNSLLSGKKIVTTNANTGAFEITMPTLKTTIVELDKLGRNQAVRNDDRIVSGVLGAIVTQYNGDSSSVKGPQYALVLRTGLRSFVAVEIPNNRTLAAVESAKAQAAIVEQRNVFMGSYAEQRQNPFIYHLDVGDEKPLEFPSGNSIRYGVEPGSRMVSFVNQDQDTSALAGGTGPGEDADDDGSIVLRIPAP